MQLNSITISVCVSVHLVEESGGTAAEESDCKAGTAR